MPLHNDFVIVYVKDTQKILISYVGFYKKGEQDRSHVFSSQQTFLKRKFVVVYSAKCILSELAE